MGPLQQFLNLCSQGEKSYSCHGNCNLLLVILKANHRPLTQHSERLFMYQKAEKRQVREEESQGKSLLCVAKGFVHLIPLILAHARLAHFTEQKTEA